VSSAALPARSKTRAHGSAPGEKCGAAHAAEVAKLIGGFRVSTEGKELKTDG
jgi:hypothetical protein